MTSKVIIAVGIATDRWAAFAKNAPECVKVFTIDEVEDSVLVGTTFKEIPYGQSINIRDLDKDKAIESFKEYVKLVRQVSRPDFETDEAFEQWNDIFSSSEIEVFVFSD